MTIKEVEQLLEVPRATIRFYEKENLIKPVRESNGYRDYSEYDVGRLKQIILLRKIGFSVTDIEDVLDEARTLDEVLEENLVRLGKQIEELNGAVLLSKRLKSDDVDIASFDVDKYWNVLEDAERRGNKFMDIARDIADTEKKTVFSYMGWTDMNGNLYDFPKSVIKFIGLIFILGIACCFIRGEWTLVNFMSEVTIVAAIILVESIIRIPLLFFGNRRKDKE